MFYILFNTWSYTKFRSLGSIPLGSIPIRRFGFYSCPKKIWKRYFFNLRCLLLRMNSRNKNTVLKVSFKVIVPVMDGFRRYAHARVITDLKNMADHHEERTLKENAKSRKRRQQRLPQNYKRILRRDKCWKKVEKRGETNLD